MLASAKFRFKFFSENLESEKLIAIVIAESLTLFDLYLFFNFFDENSLQIIYFAIEFAKLALFIKDISYSTFHLVIYADGVIRTGCAVFLGIFAIIRAVDDIRLSLRISRG